MLIRDNHGFTLIEVMVAIIIMMVGALGLLQSINVALEHNLKNSRRDEVIRVADEVMSGMKGQEFNKTGFSTPGFVSYTTVSSKILNSNVNYRVRRMVTAVSTDSHEYQVDVRWAYKNYSALHSIVTVRGKP